ncbi:MAG TPA: hypothetical protein VN539_02100, partial [Candidatus Saccharimonadales bacterium]|nr:hypothetical protein [Candidatus Saccharimonadales bacterium]
AGSSHVRSTTGPGVGFLTLEPSLIRALKPEYRVTPILTAGDTLISDDSGAPPFIFAGRAAGLGARDRGDGNAEVFVSHEDLWLDTFEGGAVSRLVLDLRNAGVREADYFLRTEKGYQGLAHAALLDSKVGFLRPELLINERGHGSRIPLVTAIDALTGTIQDLPWLGAMRHKHTIALPATGGRTLLVTVGGATNGAADQLFLYVANSDNDVLTGRGQLHVLRADPTSIPYSSRSASRLRRNLPVRATFIPVDDASTRSTATLEPRVQALGCLNFVRLEGLAMDREKPNSFYFTDRLGYGQGAFVQTAAGGGRLYHVTLDPFDPTQVQELEVVLDAGEGDDMYRPSSIDTDDQCVMIQEYPGSRGVHPSRILRYLTRERRLEAVAECIERDTRGRVDPKGVGGEWETSGITNVSDLFGEDSWLFTVQAHTVEVYQDRRRTGELGQLLILRGPRHPGAPAPLPAR